jgi:hypothetical protein
VRADTVDPDSPDGPKCARQSKETGLGDRVFDAPILLTAQSSRRADVDDATGPFSEGRKADLIASIAARRLRSMVALQSSLAG